MREDAQYSETATSLNDTNEEGGDINIGLRGGRGDENALHGSSVGRQHLKRKVNKMKNGKSNCNWVKYS